MIGTQSLQYPSPVRTVRQFDFSVSHFMPVSTPFVARMTSFTPSRSNSIPALTASPGKVRGPSRFWIVTSYFPLPPARSRNVPSGPFHLPSHLSEAGSGTVGLGLAAFSRTEPASRSLQPVTRSANARDAAEDRCVVFMWRCRAYDAPRRSSPAATASEAPLLASPLECRVGRHLDARVVHSITSSACRSIPCGIVMPRALATFRLTTNSNTLGCSIGRSPGLTPFRILSTYPADRRIWSCMFAP